MSPERWQQLKQIFAAAASVAPNERAQFLDEQCGDDEELRREVESLLASFDDAGSFMEKPAVTKMAKTILNEDERLAPGARLSHYKIVEPIGTGGMGEVYLVEDTKLNRRVALKLLPSAFTSDDEANRRLLREARAAATLDHPNVCAIHEIGEAEGRRFIVMQFVEGETLAERMKRERLSVSETVGVAAQIADALAEAHSQRIIHRDIKPSNIIITRRGQVKVLDFGLAKFIVEKSSVEESETAKLLSATGALMGTVPYMSPEQARGERLDGRTDIFSLGVMLAEMLSGECLFRRDSNAETIAAILTFEPPIDEQLACVPEALRRIVKRCLAKDKTERYKSADELLRDLCALEKRLDAETKGGQSAASEIGHEKSAQDKTLINAAGQNGKTQILQSTPPPVLKSTRRKFFVFGALVCGLAALAGVWFVRARRDSFTPVSMQRTTQVTNWSGLDDFPTLSPDGKMVAYCSDHNGSFEIYTKQLTSGAKETQLTNDGGQNLQPAFSPDGQRIAYYSKTRGGIWVIPATGGEAKQLTEFGSHPAWSPDGKLIAFQSNPVVDLGATARNAISPSTLWIVSSQGGEAKQLTKSGNPSGGHGAPAWSPDGRRIVFEVDTLGTAGVWSIAASGDHLQRITEQRGDYEPIYAPDGKSIFVAGGGVRQIPINPATDEPLGEASPVTGISGAPTFVRRISFSADGKHVAYNTLLRRESLPSVRLDAKTGEAVAAPVALTPNASIRNNYPAFSPDGKRIAFASCLAGGTGCDIWLVNADGSNETQLTTDDHNEMQPNWFSDGQRVAFTSDRTGHSTLWEIELNGKRERMLFDLKENFEHVRLSPDGKQIVFNYRKDGIINVWKASLDSGDMKQLTFDKELMGFATFSPDGKYIAFQMKRGDDTHIMVMTSEGSDITQLTFDKGQSWAYSWSPDSDKILFAGFRDGLWNIRWVSRTTKEQKQLTNYMKLNSFVRYPAWSPTGDQIVYEYCETTGNVWVADLK